MSASQDPDFGADEIAAGIVEHEQDHLDHRSRAPLTAEVLDTLRARDSGSEHDRALARDVLSMTPRQRLEELTIVEQFFDRAIRLD